MPTRTSEYTRTSPIMSVSALISQFSNASTDTESPPRSHNTTPGGSLGRRHYSTSSVGSSRSESPASCRSHSPHLDASQSQHLSVGNESSPRVRLSSITEDRIRMFNSRCSQAAKDSTDGPPRNSSGSKAAARQLSAGSNEPGKGSGVRKELTKRQLSAGSSPVLVRGRSPSPFRLPGLAMAAGGEYGEGRGGRLRVEECSCVYIFTKQKMCVSEENHSFCVHVYTYLCSVAHYACVCICTCTCSI